MRMAYYDTAKFKKLRDAWYKKLAKSGFQDAEEEKNGRDWLKRWHSSYFQTKHTPDSFRAKEMYYQIALKMLHTYPFSNSFERQVWTMHSNGISLRLIALELDCNKDKVHITVKRIVAAMKDFTKQNELLEND